MTRTPRVRLQSIVVESGSADPEILKRIIRQRAPELGACYVRRLAERPDLAGQLHFRLRLADDGDVLSADAVADTLGDAELLSCVKASMQTLVLPAPEAAPVLMVVPLIFRSVASARRGAIRPVAEPGEAPDRYPACGALRPSPGECSGRGVAGKKNQ